MYVETPVKAELLHFTVPRAEDRIRLLAGVPANLNHPMDLDKDKV